MTDDFPTPSFLLVSNTAPSCVIIYNLNFDCDLAIVEQSQGIGNHYFKAFTDYYLNLQNKHFTIKELKVSSKHRNHI